MGRSQELKLQARRVGRSCLDRASASLDRIGSFVRERMARRHGGVGPPTPSPRPVPPARSAVARTSAPGSADTDAAPVLDMSERTGTPVGADTAAASAAAIDLSDLTKAELYRLAQQHDIAGRSKLSKDQLVRALEAVGD